MVSLFRIRSRQTVTAPLMLVNKALQADAIAMVLAKKHVR
jgi:hypothetical protein